MRRDASHVQRIVALLLAVATAALFVYLAPLTYGHVSLTPEQVLARKLVPEWQLHYVK